MSDNRYILIRVPSFNVATVRTELHKINSSGGDIIFLPDGNQAGYTNSLHSVTQAKHDYNVLESMYSRYLESAKQASAKLKAAKEAEKTYKVNVFEGTCDVCEGKLEFEWDVRGGIIDTDYDEERQTMVTWIRHPEGPYTECDQYFSTVYKVKDYPTSEPYIPNWLKQEKKKADALREVCPSLTAVDGLHCEHGQYSSLKLASLVHKKMTTEKLT